MNIIISITIFHLVHDAVFLGQTRFWEMQHEIIMINLILSYDLLKKILQAESLWTGKIIL